MNTWSQVDILKDGSGVNAETFNKPIGQLASRTEYLRRRLGSILEDGVQSSIVLPDVQLSQEPAYEPEVGNVVYCNVETMEFRKAQATMHLCDSFKAADSAFLSGILIDKNGTTGSVLIYGKVNLGDSSSYRKSSMLQDGEQFRSGRYYLSATEAGKITSRPTGPLIFVGTFYSDNDISDSFSADAVGYVNPQFLDIGTSHVHRAYPLTARPAGSVSGTSVVGYLPIAESSSSTPSGLPSLIFGGTWTSNRDVSYDFSLSNGGAWGEVTLNYSRNGAAAVGVPIPAGGVFVDIDDGLKVKVLFPDADEDRAYEGLDEDERTWATLRFPYAGKGWVDHEVSAIASVIESDSSDEAYDGPELKVLFSGRWPDSDNTVYSLFPEAVYTKTYEDSSSSEDNIATIDGIVYEFVPKGSQAQPGNTAITKAATVNETLHNLAAEVNRSQDSALVFVHGDELVVCNLSFDESTKSYEGVGDEGFEVVGGTIPVMVNYTAYYETLGPVIAEEPAYTPIAQNGLKMTLFAGGAKAGSAALNFICSKNTRLMTSAFDNSRLAAYDYVMGLDQDVDYYFPPVPAQSAGLFVNGVEVENKLLFPDNPCYSVGRKTISWFDSVRGKTPWPEDIKHHDDVVEPYKDKTMLFSFVVGFQCATGPVTSIVPAPDSGLKFYTYGTSEEASTGDLAADVAVDLSVTDGQIPGYRVAKEGRNGKLLAGPVVERIKEGPGIVVSQASGCPRGQGTVTISLDDGSLRGSFGEIALENAKQEKIGLFPYVSLLGWGPGDNIPSAFTTMMRVSTNLDKEKDYRLHMKLVMFGLTGYSESRRQAAGIQLEYNILPDYTGDIHASLKSGLMIPDNPRRIAVPLGHQSQQGSSWSYTAYDPFVATTEITKDSEDKPDVTVPFSKMPIPSASEFSTVTPTLKPGYLVAVRLSRIANPSTDTYGSYTGALGFLAIEWSLEEV